LEEPKAGVGGCQARESVLEELAEEEDEIGGGQSQHIGLERGEGLVQTKEFA